MPIAIVVALFVGSSPAAASHQIALGISKSNGDETMAALDYFTSANDGIAPSLWTLRSKWGGPDRKFPTATAAALQSRGVTPLIWWSPMNPKRWWAGKYEKLQTIINGNHDDYIRQWAQDAKAFDQTVIVRFAHEANVHVFPWGKTWFTNTPKRFRKAWKHVVRIFDEENADNVKFLWSVAKQSCGGCNPYKKYFPGNQWVDYVGFSGFNWGGYNGRKWVSMIKSYAQPMKKIGQFTSKPVIVAETASHYKNGNKAKWIKKGYNGVYDKWHRLEGIVWLDSAEPHKDFGHPDWRLKKPKNGSARAAYRTISAKPDFQGSLD